MGTRQFFRNNMTMYSGYKVVCNCHFTIFVVAITYWHGGLTIFQIFSRPWLALEAFLHCRVVVVPKVKYCRVLSSVNTHYIQHLWEATTIAEGIRSLLLNPKVTNTNPMEDTAKVARRLSLLILIGAFLHVKTKY